MATRFYICSKPEHKGLHPPWQDVAKLIICPEAHYCGFCNNYSSTSAKLIEHVLSMHREVILVEPPTKEMLDCYKMEAPGKPKVRRLHETTKKHVLSQYLMHLLGTEAA